MNNTITTSSTITYNNLQQTGTLISGLSTGTNTIVDGVSTITTSPYITNVSGYFNTQYSTSKIKYTIFGEEIEVNGYYNFETASFISLLTINGWKYYEEMIKNGMYLDGELNIEIEKRYLIYRRDQKIDNILETK